MRYTRTQRRVGGNPFISFISLISVLGSMLGVAALIVVLSVMNGFQQEVRDRILAVVSHIEISSHDGTLNESAQVRQSLLANQSVHGAAPFIEAPIMLTNAGVARGAVVRGINPMLENQVAAFTEHMQRGQLEALTSGHFGIVLGSDLAWALGVELGEKITLLAPQGQMTPAGLLPRLKQFTVVGIFEVGMYEYDAGLALIALADAQKLYRLQGDEVTGIRLKVGDIFAAPAISRQLQADLGFNYRVRDWTRTHANFFRAVALEKRMMFLILLLIVAVAAFNIVSTLVMAISEKQSDIAILRTLGATPRSIMLIFMTQGITIGCVGLLAGIGLGVTVALNIDVIVPFLEKTVGFSFLPKEVYMITDLPSRLSWMDVSMISIASFLLTVLATLYPSWQASRIQPAEALRYE